MKKNKSKPQPEALKSVEPIPPSVPVYDELMAFVFAYQKGGIFVPIFPSQLDGVRFFEGEGIASFIIYQTGKFQVVLTLLAPEQSIIELRGPALDSLITHIAGSIAYTKNHEGVLFGSGDYSQPMENGVSKLNGQCIRVTPKDSFGAKCGTIPGAFLSFNMRTDGLNWLNPTKPEAVKAAE